MTLAARIRHLLIATSAAVAGTAALGASPALAERVMGPAPWKASNTYQAQADLNGRVAPRVNAIGEVNHVRKGQWIHIQCQTLGEEAYGSQVWIKTARGQYVPDAYVKTYTTGFVRGVPFCQQPQQQPQQPTGPGRNELYIVAHNIAFERYDGPLYERYRATYDDDLVFDTNGCSVPLKIFAAVPALWPSGISLAFYSSVFERSCDRHDFGYRNFGKGDQLNRTDEMRKRLDDKMEVNMDLQCKKRFAKRIYFLQKKACFAAVEAFHGAVRLRGAGHFYG